MNEHIERSATSGQFVEKGTEQKKPHNTVRERIKKKEDKRLSARKRLILEKIFEEDTKNSKKIYNRFF